jgi:lipopolysaccharide export system protein LptC
VIDQPGAWFPLLLLAGVAALTFWLERAVQPYISVQSNPVGTNPDYIVYGLSATRMDEAGRVKHTLKAARMTHYPSDDRTVLEHPQFVTYSEARAPVTITARDALMSANGENVYFENDVRVVRAPYANATELVVETSYLHVIPDKHVAQTDRAVTIRDAHAVVTASGLELNSETRLLQLHGRVKGIYHDPTRAR